MRFTFIAATKAEHTVTILCRCLRVTRSGFYAWQKRPRPARAKSDAQLAATVAAVHLRSRRTYGSPRVHRELLARGVRVGKKRVERLMRENGIQGRRKRRFKHTRTPIMAARSLATCSLESSAWPSQIVRG